VATFLCLAAIPQVGAAAVPKADAPAIVWKQLGASSDRPLIFLSALGLPGRYFEKVYEQFEKDHPVCVATYAGSDGLPATKPPFLPRIVEAVHGLIESERLQGAVLVGHLFGAYVALHVAGQYPDSVGGVFVQPIVWEHRRGNDRGMSRRGWKEME